jgi:hypothetical protein
MRSVWASLIFFLAASQATAEEFSAEKYIADGAAMLFWNACVKFYPNPKGFEEWISGNLFDEVPEAQAGGFIRERGGRAYSVNNNGVRYLLVVEPSNLCSVFVKEVNLDLARQAFDAWLGVLKTKGWVEFDSMKHDTRANKTLRTTSYEYSLAGERVMIIGVSEALVEGGSYQLAMSASVQRGANHSLQARRPDEPRPELKRWAKG